MTDKIAIRVKNLGKKYNIGGPQEKYHTLRDAMVNSLKAPFKTFHHAQPAEEFWALKDVTFDVEQGEVVGIIGRNGAGKSTLLKILSRITTPTKGTVEIHGRVGSLLEVGTGFHPEMTGRENIFLNGSILGMKKTEIEQKFDEIVKFSEIEKFIDTPVKRYSSGMYVRLAFAVAAHLEPEILVIDEVLAVGDAAFQKKCLGKMGAVAKEGRTVLFVSHNLIAIKNLCNRGILIEKGTLNTNSDIDAVLQKYFLTSVVGNNLSEKKYPLNHSLPIQIIGIKAYNRNSFYGNGLLTVSEPIIFEIEYCIRKRITGVVLALIILDIYGTRLLSTEDVDCNPDLFSERTVGTYITKFELPKDLINKGEYIIRVACGAPNFNIQYHDDEALHITFIDSSGRIVRNRRGVLSIISPWITEKIN